MVAKKISGLVKPDGIIITDIPELVSAGRIISVKE